jgi:hypothetical protein|tara:strand:+ start:459 stop:695 length:237 start_codon:yes stop_codon:yes gene_type:complete
MVDQSKYNKEYNRLRLINTIEVLEDTIEWYKPRIEPHDCGWMYTTIDGLKHRINEAKKELKSIDKQKKTIKHSIPQKS